MTDFISDISGEFLIEVCNPPTTLCLLIQPPYFTAPFCCHFLPSPLNADLIGFPIKLSYRARCDCLIADDYAVKLVRGRGRWRRVDWHAAMFVTGSVKFSFLGKTRCCKFTQNNNEIRRKFQELDQIVEIESSANCGTDSAIIITILHDSLRVTL